MPDRHAEANFPGSTFRDLRDAVPGPREEPAMPGLFEPIYRGDLSDVELDPRLLEFAMRQRKALSAFTAKQAQQYVQQALIIRKELERNP